jgi:O-succinylbenzoate synthase
VCNLEGRSRLILHLQEGSKESWGEAAPLPGWSEESLEDIVKQAITLTPPFAPSLTFGMLSALANLRDPLPDIPPVPVSYFLSGTLSEIGVQAEKAILSGFKSAKLKIGHLDFNEALYLVRQLKDHLYLRLDVNQAWDLDEALSFFSHFKKEDFDYVEEPLKNPEELRFFTHPFALDESLRDNFFIDHPLLKALVIKPTLHEDWLKWLGRGKEIILSSAFESDLGHAHLALLAFRLKLNRNPLGLGTFSYIRDTLLEEPLELDNGHLILPQKISVKKELLHALPLPH